MDTWHPQEQVGGVRAEPKLNSQKEEDSAHERSND
jgi:hypothetical protein